MIDAIIRGNEFAFEQAYLEHREKVYAYLLKKTRSSEDARDLMQTVFLKLWKYRKSLSADYLLEQHIFNIARTVFIDYLRTQNKRSRMEETLTANTISNPKCSYVSTAFDLRAQVGAILAEMPELRKKVFELNRFEGYSYNEIAEQLSITVKSVDNNLTKALRQLRKMVVFAAVAISVLF